MPRPPRDDSAAVQRAREILANTDDLDQIRVAQAVILPHLGLTLDQAAQVIGRDRYWVSRARNRFIKGEAPQLSHGGRRNAYFNETQERALVGDVLAHWHAATPGLVWNTSIRAMLKDRLDKEVGRPVADSTVSDMLNRYANRIIDGATWTELEFGHQLVQDLVCRLAAYERLLPQHRAKHQAWFKTWQEQKKKRGIIAS